MLWHTSPSNYKFTCWLFFWELIHKSFWFERRNLALGDILNPLTHLTDWEGAANVSHSPDYFPPGLENNTNLSPTRKLYPNQSDLFPLTGYRSVWARVQYSVQSEWIEVSTTVVVAGGGGEEKCERMQNRAARLTRSPNSAGGFKEIGSFVNKFVLQDERTDLHLSLTNVTIESILFHPTLTCRHVNIRSIDWNLLEFLMKEFNLSEWMLVLALMVLVVWVDTVFANIS